MNKSKNLVCHTCHGTDFYEDRQGSYTCQRCGALSQDFFAESHEVEELLATRGLRTIKTKTAKREVESVEAITPLECLTVYQECLKHLAKIVALQIDSSDLEASVRVIWFQYLETWRRHGWTMKTWFSRGRHAGTYRSTDTIDAAGVSIGRPKKTLFETDWDDDSDYEDNDSSDEEKKGDEPSEQIAGLAPSKPLLLGFLYLACRQLRSWVIPADLVRWCADGILPINNLWESDCIPTEYKLRFSSVPHSFERRVFSAYFKTDTLLPSVSNILFHTVALADMLCLPLCPLNGPIVAWRIVASLGLPLEVWHYYCGLTQMFHSNRIPVAGADPCDEHYVENIAATLVVASKLCPSWMQWDLYKSRFPGGDASLLGFRPICAPLREGDINMSLDLVDVPRYAQQISNAVSKAALPLLRLSMGKGVGVYNNVLQQFLQSVEGKVGKEAVNYIDVPEEKCVWKSINQPSETKSAAAVIKRNHHKKENKSDKKKPKSTDKCTYLAIPNTDSSVAWDSADPQYTMMLERMARQISIWPGDLHTLVVQLESAIKDSIPQAARQTVDGVGKVPRVREDRSVNANTHRNINISNAASNSGNEDYYSTDDEPLGLTKRSRYSYV